MQAAESQEMGSSIPQVGGRERLERRSGMRGWYGRLSSHMSDRIARRVKGVFVTTDGKECEKRKEATMI